ncbi:MAG: alanine racemase [Nitrospiraceae bacterium]
MDLSALAHNLDQIRLRIAKTCEVLAVVKADAYGHGAVGIAGALETMGVARFAVATLQEGITLREAGVRGAILIMGAWPCEHSAEVVSHRLTPVIYETDVAERFARLVSSGAQPYPVHVKIDTGMARLGLSPEQALALFDAPPFQGPLRLEGLMTHLADADNVDPDYTHMQVARFQKLVDHITTGGLRIPLIHASNSAAILFHPSAHFTAVRPGIVLYGYHAGGPGRAMPELQPVLSLTTKVAQIRALPAGQRISYNGQFTTTRPSRIAVLPVGYADGYNRLLSNRGEVLIQGRRSPVVGRICMDMTMVDVTDSPDVRPGDDAVLIGRQGAERISAADLATWLDTIPYEVLCGIGPRVPRVYR